MRTSEQQGVERRVWREVRPHWRHLAGLCLLSLLAPPLALLTPLPLKIAVDSVIGQQPLPSALKAILPQAMRHSSAALLMVAVGLILSVAVLGQLRDFASNLLATYAG